jgi:hypothetical protein
MLDDLRTGKAKLVTKSGPFAKVLAVVYPNTVIPLRRKPKAKTRLRLGALSGSLILNCVKLVQGKYLDPNT